MLQLSLQTLGGSGYLQDYPIEQYLRDAKIDSLYEGTTAIQSLDLLFRKIVRDRGRAFGHVVGEIAAFLADATGGQRPAQGGARRCWPRALADVQAMLGALTGHVGASATRAGARVQGRPAQRPAAARAGRPAGRLAAAAPGRGRAGRPRRPGPSRDQAFYQGKVAVARFFASTVLPRLSADRTIVEAADERPDGPAERRVLTAR